MASMSHNSGQDSMSEGSELISGLLNEDAYPDPAHAVECIETHASWVLLAGEYAYKLKKPLNLGFLDYSTLALRRKACEDELRLNRRTAPDVYLEVVAVHGPASAPRIGGSGPVLEYAVKMKRFDQAGLFGALLAASTLTPALIERVARHVAAFHATANVAAVNSGFGDAASVHFPVRQNFGQISERVAQPELLEQLDRIRHWSDARFEALAAVFDRRLAEGRVRECHGDLHLGNIALINDEPQLFDGIEFNPGLRWIDVIADAGFLVMDLVARGRTDLANRFLNAYLEHSGDYNGLAVLPYYVVYRAMVRAKVAAIRLEQLDAAKRAHCMADFRRYLALAEAYCTLEPSCVLITCGLSGSGKSSQSQTLIDARGVIRLRSDVERKRLFNLASDARSNSAHDAGIYTAQATRRTYARLTELAATVVRAGRPVLVDATFLTCSQREAFRALASSLDVPFAILFFDAPAEVLQLRVRRRASEGVDASEADLAVLDAQFERFEPPTADEDRYVLRVDTTQSVCWDALLPQLDRLTDGCGCADRSGVAALSGPHGRRSP